MTTTITNRGLVCIPKAVRQRKKLKGGEGFEVLATVDGDIVLRRLRRPRRSLLAHARALRGLTLVREDHPLPAPPAL